MDRVIGSGNGEEEEEERARSCIWNMNGPMNGPVSEDNSYWYTNCY